MIVAFSDAAAADIEAIGDFIAQDNPSRAVTFVQEVIECCQRLADRPMAFALVPRYAHLGIRKRTFGNYLIFYRAGEEQVDIIHIVSSSRDYDAILLAEG